MDYFQDWVTQFDNSINLMKVNMPLVLAIIGGLWVIQFINVALHYRLNILGIYPRNIFGLVGIFTSPFLHGNFNHLFFNSIPLFILLNLILLSGLVNFLSVTLTIVVLGGLGTWLFGRKALHIGASGAIMGYWSYLLLNAYQQGSALAVGLGIVCVYYLGSLFLNLLPLEARSSFEAHIFGFLGGLAANFTTPYLDPIIANYLTIHGYLAQVSPSLF